MRTKILSSDIDLANIIEKVCNYCGETYYTDNESSLYCKDSCKTKAYQERKENEIAVDGEKHSNTKTYSQSKGQINTNEAIDDYEEQISDLEERLRLSEARNKITEDDFLLLTGICADKWFAKIFDGKEKILTFKEIEKNCRQLAEMLVFDVGECKMCDHGFITSNYSLQFINNGLVDNISNENEINYLLQKINL